MGFKKLIVMAMMAIVASSTVARAESTVIYPNVDGTGDKAIGYAVLGLALKKSGQPFTLKLSDAPVNQDRAKYMLESGEISAIDTGVSKEMEARFDPIYLPMDRGVLGWRVFIIHKDSQASFSKIKTLADITKKQAGQGTGWGDIAILENAGIKVATAATIENLINMVGAKRFDFFPLGANEVFGLLDQYGKGSKDLAVEKSVVLVYPFGRFFYVKKGNEALRTAISKGMDAALADGSLQKLLESHPFFKDAFTKANLKKRARINIESPGLPEGFKGIDKKWWYDPSKK